MMYEDYSCEFLGLMDEDIVRKEKFPYVSYYGGN